MEDGTRLSPEIMESIEHGLRVRAARPMPTAGSEVEHPDRSALPGVETDEDRGEEQERRAGRLVGAARLGLVPMLVDGEEWFKHKDGLVPEDVSRMIAWHEAEAERWEARAERALFAREVLDGLEALGSTEPGGNPAEARVSARRRGRRVQGSSTRTSVARVVAGWVRRVR